MSAALELPPPPPPPGNNNEHDNLKQRIALAGAETVEERLKGFGSSGRLSGATIDGRRGRWRRLGGRWHR